MAGHILFLISFFFLSKQQVNSVSGECGGSATCVSSLRSLAPLPETLSSTPSTTLYFTFSLRYLDHPNYYHPQAYSIHDGQIKLNYSVIL